jgi:hypothetical protein
LRFAKILEVIILNPELPQNTMLKKSHLTFALVIISLFLIINAPANNPRRVNERFVIKSLQTIFAAQATFAATRGNGNYGSNFDLLADGLIDEVLANGNKYGYHFIYFNSPGSSPSSPSRFYVTATPQLYGKTGKMSFYLDESNELRGADRNGGIATNTDPFLDFCAIYENERCTITNLRTLHSAQMFYQASYGNGNFGSFTQLRNIHLISDRLATGNLSGYNFACVTINQLPGSSASFRLYATPVNYGTSGTRSFYISDDGVLHGADKNGQRADENDPPIDF